MHPEAPFLKSPKNVKMIIFVSWIQPVRDDPYNKTTFIQEFSIIIIC